MRFRFGVFLESCGTVFLEELWLDRWWSKNGQIEAKRVSIYLFFVIPIIWLFPVAIGGYHGMGSVQSKVLWPRCMMISLNSH